MTGILYTKVTSGAAGYDPGRLTTNESKPIKKDEVAYFLNLIEGERFWKLPTKMQIIASDGTIVLGKDGAQWILEGLSGGNYHVVDRWSPKNGSVRKLSLYLLKLSGLKVDDMEIY